MSRWAAYKYRFFPWQVANFAKHSNTVTEAVPEGKVCDTLVNMFNGLIQCRDSNDSFIREHLGYRISLQPSSVHGNGVFVTAGHVKAHTVVGLYPGTLYLPGDALLLQSIGNSYVFKCKDGRFIDGKPTGISRVVYSSCSDRTRLGAYVTSDKSWLGDGNQGLNPLCCGQYVNNATTSVITSVISNNATTGVISNNATTSVISNNATTTVTSSNATTSVISNNATTRVSTANVCYQEVDLDLQQVKLSSRQWVPVVPYSECTRYLRLVVLVSVCEIETGTELLSDYFTVVR